MGYYTNFTISIVEPDFQHLIEEVNGVLSDICFGGWLNGGEIHLSDTKWYGYEKDMLNLSRKFPNITFEVYGEGEENEDIWKHYFKNGEGERLNPKLVWPKPTKF